MSFLCFSAEKFICADPVYFIARQYQQSVCTGLHQWCFNSEWATRPRKPFLQCWIHSYSEGERIRVALLKQAFQNISREKLISTVTARPIMEFCMKLKQHKLWKFEVKFILCRFGFLRISAQYPEMCSVWHLVFRTHLEEKSQDSLQYLYSWPDYDLSSICVCLRGGIFLNSKNNCF